jgi:hypothetical protein
MDPAASGAPMKGGAAAAGGGSAPPSRRGSDAGAAPAASALTKHQRADLTRAYQALFPGRPAPTPQELEGLHAYTQHVRADSLAQGRAVGLMEARLGAAPGGLPSGTTDGSGVAATPGAPPPAPSELFTPRHETLRGGRPLMTPLMTPAALTFAAQGAPGGPRVVRAGQGAVGRFATTPVGATPTEMKDLRGPASARAPAVKEFVERMLQLTTTTTYAAQGHLNVAAVVRKDKFVAEMLKMRLLTEKHVDVEWLDLPNDVTLELLGLLTTTVALTERQVKDLVGRHPWTLATSPLDSVERLMAVVVALNEELRREDTQQVKVLKTVLASVTPRANEARLSNLLPSLGVADLDVKGWPACKVALLSLATYAHGQVAPVDLSPAKGMAALTADIDSGGAGRGYASPPPPPRGYAPSPRGYAAMRGRGMSPRPWGPGPPPSPGLPPSPWRVTETSPFRAARVAFMAGGRPASGDARNERPRDDRPSGGNKWATEGCWTCGEPGHIKAMCTANPKCGVCSGDHATKVHDIATRRGRAAAAGGGGDRSRSRSGMRPAGPAPGPLGGVRVGRVAVSRAVNWAGEALRGIPYEDAAPAKAGPAKAARAADADGPKQGESHFAAAERGAAALKGYEMEASINGVKVQCVLDTGAHAAMITSGTLKAVAPHVEPQKEHDAPDIILADGSAKAALGYVRLPVELHAQGRPTDAAAWETVRVAATFRFMVVDGAPADILFPPYTFNVATAADPGGPLQKLWTWHCQRWQIRAEAASPVTAMAGAPIGASEGALKGPEVAGADVVSRDAEGANALNHLVLNCDDAEGRPYTMEEISKWPALNVDYAGVRPTLVHIVWENQAAQAPLETQKGLEPAWAATFANPGQEPIKDGMRQLGPPRLAEAVTRQLEKMEKQQIVERVPESDYGRQGYLPVIAVEKRDSDDVRLVLDMRRFNDLLVKGATQLPALDEHARQFVGCYVFTDVDFAQYYYQFKIEESMKLYLGFVGPGNTFWRLCRMPMGAATSPAFGQEYLQNAIILPLTEKLAAVNCVINGLLDNLTLGTRSASGKKPEPGSAEETAMTADHAKGAQIMFAHFKELGIRVAEQLKKCTLARTHSRSFGYMLDGENWELDPDRLADLRGLRMVDKPSLAAVRSIVGMFSYWESAVNTVEYSMELRKLNDLITEAVRTTGRISSGGRSMWTAEHDAIVERLKAGVLARGVFKTLDYHRRVYLYTDASDVGYAAVLTQFDNNGVERLALLMARRFVDTQKDLKTAEKEAYAVVMAVRKFGRMLQHLDWVLCTDAKNLKDWRSTQTPLLRRWYLEVMHVCKWVMHVPGVFNVVADALSRHVRVESAPGRGPVLALPALSAAMPRVRARRAAVVAPQAEAGREEKEGGKDAVGGAADVGSDVIALAKGDARDFSDVLFGGAEVREHLSGLSPETLRAAQGTDELVQRMVAEGQLELLKVSDGGYLYALEGRVMIPPSAPDLERAVLMAAHEASGHGGRTATLHRLNAVWMQNKYARVEKHVDSCAGCAYARAPPPRPEGDLTPELVGGPFHTLLLDFQGPFVKTTEGYVAVLTMTCAATRWLDAAAVKELTSDAAVAALTAWMDKYDAQPLRIKVDNGSHFKGRFPAFCEENGIELHVTHAYRPQSLGLAERQHGVILKALSASLSPATVDKWSDLLGYVVDNINTSYNRTLKMSPWEARFGTLPQDALRRALGLREVEVDNERFAATRLRALRNAAEAAIKEAALYEERHPAAREYAPGDAVLLRYDSRPTKLHSWARGPFFVTHKGINDNWYWIGVKEGDDFVNEQEVHVSRLQALDLSRTSPAIEELREKGPDHFVVEDIVRHEPHPEYGKELVFYVRWADGDVSPAALEDLMGNPVFKRYAAAAGVQPGRLQRQIRAERERAKRRVSDAIPPEGDEGAETDEKEKSDGTNAAGDGGGARHAGSAPRRPRATELRGSDRVAVEGHPADAKFNVGASVALKASSWTGIVKSVLYKLEGEYFYDIKFEGHKAGKGPSQGYAESELTAFDAEAKRSRKRA